MVLCCCCCGSSGPSLSDVLKSRPSTSASRAVLLSVQETATADRRPLFFRLLCFPCICCPCCPCTNGDSETATDATAITEASSSEHDSGFLGDREMVPVFTTVLAFSKGRVRTEHLGAALALVSIGSIEEKIRTLFDAFSGGAGITKETIKRMIGSIVHAGERMARKIADAVSAVTTGGAFPGGKVIGLALATFGIVAFPAIIAAGTRKVVKAMDKDGDGDIDWSEFRSAALSRGSIIRKFIAWFDRRLRALCGDTAAAAPMSGYLTVDGERKFCFLDVEPPNERITFFDSKESKESGAFHTGEVSLLEPCALKVSEHGEGQERFSIVDKDKKTWNFVAESQEVAFDWTDSLEDYCEAEDEEKIDVEGEPIQSKKRFGCC